MTFLALLAVLLMATPKGLWLWVIAAILLVALFARRRGRKPKAANNRF